MHFIARVGHWAYILDARGQLQCVPLIPGEVSYPIDADLAADSCRRHAIEEDAAGNWSKAAAFRRAALALDALDALDGTPEPSAATAA